MPQKELIDKIESGVQEDTSNSKLHRITAYIIILVGIMFSLIQLSEFYNVAIAGEAGAYPWGPVNDNPWYYRTASIYSNYNLTSGLLFLGAGMLTLWATLKNNRKFILVGASITLLLFLAAAISTDTQ